MPTDEVIVRFSLQSEREVHHNRLMSVESTGELEQENAGVPNRIEDLGAAYFKALALPRTYYGSEAAYLTRQEAYRGLPQELNLTEVETLTAFVGQQAVEAGLKHPERIETRMLGWLGRMSIQKNDTETTSSVIVVTNNRADAKSKWWQFRRNKA
jgi:hypothetical protein